MQPLAKGRRTPLGQLYATGPRSENLARGAGGRQAIPIAQDIALFDLTADDRFGIKGNGAGHWLRSRKLTVPEHVNTLRATDQGFDVVRLGSEDFVLLARPDGQSKSLAEIREDWANDRQRPKGFDAWREEVWAWFHICGAQVATLLAKTCPVDLAAAQFPLNSVAQTRVAQTDCIVVRSDRASAKQGFDLLFDIASSEYMLRSLQELGSTL